MVIVNPTLARRDPLAFLGVQPPNGRDSQPDPTIRKLGDTNRDNIYSLPMQSDATIGTWFPIEYNGPAVLKITGCFLLGGATPVPTAMVGSLLAAPFDIPIRDADARRMDRGGVVLMDRVCKWYFKYSVPAAIFGTTPQQTIRVRVMDSSNPLVAAEYLSYGGTPRVRTFNSATVASLNVVNTIVEANFERLGLILRNGDGNATNNKRTIAYTFGDVDPTAVSETTNGNILAPGAVDVLSGDVLGLGPIRAIYTGPGGVIPAAGVADFLYVTEYSR